MSLLKSNSVQIGQSATATNNFTLSVPSSPDGTIKLARGNSGATTADILSVNASGVITGSTFSGATITSSTVNGGTITSATAQASTSGTAIDFTGIPSWVKKITVMLSNVSTNGASFLRMQLGVGGVATTTGYLGSCLAAITGAVDVSTFSSGVDFSNSAADGDRKHGNVTFTNVTGGTWSFTGMTGLSNTGRMSYLSGSVPLSGTLDMVRVTTVNGTDAFDFGTVNIMYEG